MSRPILLALVGAILALAAFFATSGARNSGDDAGETPIVQEPARSADSGAESAATPAKGKASASSRSDSSAGGTSSQASDKAGKDNTLKVPAPVRRALDRNQRVVLFFKQPGAADDDATARAVASVRGQRGAAVFSAPITRLSDYEGVTGDLGISQAPAIVVVGKDGKARLVEGFVDGTSLAQEVADTR